MDSANINISAANYSGYTALMMAVIKDNENIVELLLQNFIDINTIDNRGNTALMMAAMKGYDKIVRLLIKQK